MTGTACPWLCLALWFNEKSLEEDYERKKENPSALGEKLLDWYTHLLISKSWSGAFLFGGYFLSQDSRVKGVSFLNTSDNSIEEKW